MLAVDMVAAVISTYFNHGGDQTRLTSTDRRYEIRHRIGNKCELLRRRQRSCRRLVVGLLHLGVEDDVFGVIRVSVPLEVFLQSPDVCSV